MLLSICANSQPSKTQVATRLTHTGVVKVDVYNIEKIWDKNKYVWRAGATITKKVEPTKVDGLTGVTLVYNASAYYDLGATQPYQVLGAESDGEYQGINLPIPSINELQQFATTLMQQHPEAFFKQAYDIIEVESVKINNLKPIWLHPRRLAFTGTMVYVQKLTAETFQKLQGPCNMVLHRPIINQAWNNITGERDYNQARYIGEIIHVADAPKHWRNAPALSIKAQMNIAPTVNQHQYSTPQELVNDFTQKLFTLTKDQCKTYLTSILHSTLRQPNSNIPNGNGDALIKNILDDAYIGWGKYQDQYCATPAKQEVLSKFDTKWYNKAEDVYSKLNYDKDGNNYAITGAMIIVTKKEAENQKLSLIECTQKLTSTETNLNTNNTYKIGDKVLVKEGIKWYPAVILNVRNSEWYIHYDGYDAKYDLWVDAKRIKNVK